MKISPGDRVGSFEIRAAVGAGGMGTVYRAHDTKLGRDVAIKILQEKLSDRPDYLRRFEREARSASALNHPNIVTVFEINEFDGAPYIAMEMIEGKRIRDLLRDGPIPLRKLLNIATQIADGLAAAHDRSIVHRDIKPENVMLTHQGLVKILDFGLARTDIPRESISSSDGSPDDSDAITSENITRDFERRLFGTAGYMSPEQAAGSTIDHRTDQFSFGSMLYEMATGRRAFSEESISRTLHAIIHDEPIPIRQLNAKIPEPLCWIIERCLAKDPNDRYASTTDLAHELHSMRERLPDTGSNVTALPFSKSSRRRAMFLAAPTALLIVLATAIGIWNRGEPTRSPRAADAYVAVLPFQDLTGDATGALFSRGFAEAVSERLKRLSSVQVIPPTSSAPLIAEGANDRRIAQELGATWILKATIQRIGDALKVRYTLFDSIRNEAVVTDTISGSIDNVWALQDDLTNAIAGRLGLEKVAPSSERDELETAEEQELYIVALGCLTERHEDPKALDEGLSKLRELLETASDSPLVHAALARLYLEKYNVSKEPVWTERATQASERARVLAPDSPEVLHAQASVQLFTARYGDAITTYKRTLALQPNSAEAVLGLAKAYNGAGQIDDAERTFTRAIRLRSWWSSHNEMGVFYLSRGRYDDAVREFNKVIELNPQTSWGYVNLGAVLMTKERLTDAIAAFTKATTLREDPAAYANLGYCYYYLQQFDRSAESYRKAASIVPRRATYWAGIADACRWSSRCRSEVDAANARAIELLQQELAVNPGSARAHASLAVCLAQAGRRREAEDHIRAALQLEPENPARMFQAGRVANLTGNPVEAVSWFRRAHDREFGRYELPRDPEFAELRLTDPYRAVFVTRPVAP